MNIDMIVFDFLKTELQKIKEQPTRLLLHLGVIAALSLNIWFLLIHESYRDEAQAWLIARDTGPLSVFKVLSYEGHPFLWYYLLMPFAKLGFPYVTIKVISTVLMAAVILMIGYRSPFPIPVRLCILLSGMCLYRYASFGRSYSLFAFLTVLICCLYRTRHKKPVRYLMVISAMIQTHVIAIGFAFGLCVAYLMEELMQLKISGFSGRTFFQRLSPLLMPFCSAFFLFFEFFDINNASYLQISKHAVLKTIIPTINYGLKNLLGNTMPLFVILFVFHVFFLLVRYRQGLGYLMVLLTGWAGGIWVFSVSVRPADYRVMMLAYMLLWYLWCTTNDTMQNDGRKKSAAFHNVPYSLFSVSGTALAVVLVLGIDLTMAKDLKLDIKYRYTDARNTAAVVDSLPSDSVILECSEDFCNAVIPWLHRNTVVNPFSDETATYIKRNNKLRHSMSSEELMEYCRRRFPEIKEVYLLYCEKDCKIKNFSAEGLEVIYEYPRDKLVTSECYKIFRIPMEETEKVI